MSTYEHWGGVIFDPIDTVGRIMQRTNKHYNTQNTKALGLVILKVFYAFPMMPLGVACMDPRGMVGRIVVSEKRFFMFVPLKAMGANDPLGEVIFYPRSMTGQGLRRGSLYIADTKI